MLPKYQVNTALLGLNEAQHHTVILLNHTQQDTKALAYPIFNAHTWLSSCVLVPPPEVPPKSPTLYALRSRDWKEGMTGDLIIQVFEGETPPTGVGPDGVWIRPADILAVSEPQYLLGELDWRVLRELERLCLPEDHPLRVQREAWRAEVSQ